MTATPIPGRTRAALERGEARRRAILEAAVAHIAQHGSRATTLADVAAAAGVTRPGLLHHFPSKQALLEAVLDEHLRLAAPAFMRIAEPGGLDSVLTLVEIARKDVADRTQLALWNRLVSENSEPGAPLHDRLQASYRRMRVVVAGFLEQARERGELRDGVDAEHEAVALLALLNGLETSWLLDPTVPLVAVAERHLAETVARLRVTPG